MINSLGKSLLGVFHPKILWISFRPFLLTSIVWALIFFWLWEPALESIRLWVTESSVASWLQNTISFDAVGHARALLAPFILVMLLIPIITITLLVLISLTSIPAVIQHLSRQPAYQNLFEARGGNFLSGLLYAFLSIMICLFFIVLTFPVWWIPPVMAVLPPLLWGWLTMRLMSYDVLARHASKDERYVLMKNHRGALLLMGITIGLLGIVPSFFWASSVLSFIFFPVVSILALWMYSMLFIFASLWFGHFLLSALRQYRHC
jgi:hypothetical protein